MIARLACLVLLSLSACSKPSPPAPPAERTAPVSPDTPLNLAKPDEARVGLDLAAARTEVRTRYQVDGAYPKSISELRVKLSFPDDLSYDPATGTVRSKTYPRL